MRLAAGGRVAFVAPEVGNVLGGERPLLGEGCTKTSWSPRAAPVPGAGAAVPAATRVCNRGCIRALRAISLEVAGSRRCQRRLTRWATCPFHDRLSTDSRAKRRSLFQCLREGVALFRLLEHETAREGDFEPRLSRSQAKLRGVPELFRGSLSHWLEHGQAVAASERRACFVARLELPADSLIRVALTEEWGEGHVDVWAHPHDLLTAVAAVVREQKRA